jgi:electron transport complex protein RnfG
MKHILKPALSLFIIAAVCTTMLSLVRDITLEPIQNQRKKTQENTMKAVLNEATEFRELGHPSDVLTTKSGSIVSIYEGSSRGEVVGYVVELSPSGYSGEIYMMVGISSVKSEITGMRVIRHSETPGLGALAVKESFYSKYDGKKLVPLNVVRVSPGANDIEAITAATITSRAITNAVNEAIEWYKNYEVYQQAGAK